MLLFSESIAIAIDRMLKANGQGRTLITLPSYPPSFMLSIASRLSALASSHQASFELKIALNTLEGWEEKDRKIVADNAWNDTRGNLTYYRNTLSGNNKTLVVLCGVDKVTDIAGLEDFTFCDESFIWGTQRKKLFLDWLTISFTAMNQDLPEDSAMGKVQDLLEALRLLPSGGLLKISEWLDGMDMAGILTGKELLLRLLCNLDVFGLPNCQGFASNKARKNFNQYAKAAQPFFEYASLIKSQDRSTAHKAVELAIDLLDKDDPKLRILSEQRENICPSYETGKDFLEGLLKYIDNEDLIERKKLLDCDFVTIHDVILRCRAKKISPVRESPRKLYGPMLDSLLSALWLTLGMHCKKNKESGFALPGCLRLRGECYNFTNESENGDKSLSAEICSSAREQLKHILDGVDNLLAKYLQTDGGIAVYSNLFFDNLPTSATRQVPNFCFAVEVAESFAAEPLLTAHFSWIIPEKHCDRLDAELIRRAAIDAHKSEQPFVPVYRLPYYEELLNAPDDEDTREILRHSLRDNSSEHITQNLLQEEGSKRPDPLMKYLKCLAIAYKDFLQHAACTSLTNALCLADTNGDSFWGELKQAYEEALRRAKEYAAQGTSDLGPLLMRAFLLTNPPLPEQEANWRVSDYENSAIITVLHPALLEQILAQTVFLCASFRHACQQALDCKIPFPPRIWHRYLHMARTHAPLCTLLRTPEKSLASELRGNGHIHKIGHIEHASANTLSTRLHSDGTRFQDKLSDADLYEESDESSLLDGLLQQYYKLRPQAYDGISLAIFRNTSIQPVIAGLHAFLQHLAKDPTNSLSKRVTPYDVRLIFFSKSSDAADLRTWLTHWQARWEAARNDDTETTNSCYRHCHITVDHKLSRNNKEFEELLQTDHLDVDIALLYGILDNGEMYSRFIDIDFLDITNTELKFPILEKKYCPSRQEIEALERSRVISRHQFPISLCYAELLHALKTSDVLLKSSLVISTGNFGIWKNSISALHRAAEWVICIDPAMDEALIRDSASPDRPRDIIAFGSGVGSHGEANYTISSEQLSCQDLCAHISHRLISLYGNNAPDKDTCDTMTQNLLHAEKLAGMALIRAASLQDTYIHDFLAYSLSRRLLQAPGALCDTMISLDAYRHWFPSPDELHPDLLWITGEEREGRFHLQARLVECKLGHANDNYIYHAHSQLRNGLSLLEPLFKPRGQDELDDARPDRRYWWHQLHRVITSSLYAEQAAEAKKLAALLEQLSEGQFTIEWEALLLTYWTDDDNGEARWIESWDINGITARQCAIGRPLQLRLALEENTSTIWPSLQEQVQTEIGEDRYPNTDADQDDLQEDGSRHDDSGENIDTVYDAGDDEETPDWERNYLAPDAIDSAPKLTPEQELAMESLWKQDSMTPDDCDVTNTLADNQNQTPPPKEGDGTSPETLLTGCDIKQNISVNSQEESDLISTTGLPEQILLGTDKSGREVYWRFQDAVNRHLIIFGSSGNGKTYAIQCILAELARKNLNTMVLDYSQSFVPNEILPPVATYFPDEQQHFVVEQPLPINPLTRQSQQFGEKILKESPVNVADRITDIFKKAFNLGTQQVNTLRDAVSTCLQQSDATTLQNIEDILDTFRDDGRHSKSTVDSLQSHVHNFVLTNPFTEPKDNTGWEWIYGATPPCNHVFQMANIAPLFAAGIIEFVLWDLFFYTQRSGNPSCPSIVVLDEIQNLSLQAGSPVDRILREGRKFGIGLIAATQSFSGVKSALSVLNQAACKLYFRPADNEMAECGKQLHDVDSSLSPSEWKERLAQLKRGECFIIAPATAQERSVRFVKIASMEERGFGN